MRISDWSSDVCSSDLVDRLLTELSDDIRRQSAYVGIERQDLNAMAVAIKHGELFGTSLANRTIPQTGPSFAPAPSAAPRGFVATIGRASGRERVCQYVSISVVSVTFKKKNIIN